MKRILKSALAAGIALAPIAFASSVQAQTAGIATSVPEAVVARSQARVNAYQQIGQTYSAQVQQVSTMRQEMAALQKSLDTNGDQQVTEAEVQANPGVVQQIQQKQQQIEATLQPVILAQAYAIEQVLAGYPAAREQVVQQKNIQLMLAPEVFQYAPPGTDVTEDIVVVLNQRVPTVQAVPPANYQPSRGAAEMHSAVQQLMLAAAQRQAAQNAQQQNQPSGR